MKVLHRVLRVNFLSYNGDGGQFGSIYLILFCETNLSDEGREFSEIHHRPPEGTGKNRFDGIGFGSWEYRLTRCADR